MAHKLRRAVFECKCSGCAEPFPDIRVGSEALDEIVYLLDVVLAVGGREKFTTRL
jgi:hypothetical protein